MALDFISLLVIGVVLGALIGFMFSKLSIKIKNKALEKRGLDFIEGKRKNEIKIDGEVINVNKFKFRDYEGTLQDLEIKPIKPLANNSIPKKKSLLQRLGIAK